MENVIVNFVRQQNVKDESIIGRSISGYRRNEAGLILHLPKQNSTHIEACSYQEVNCK